MDNEQIQNLITDNTTDDKIDYNVIGDSIRSSMKQTNESNESDYKKQFNQETISIEAVNTFLKSNNFENVDAFTTFSKNAKATTDEVKEKATRLETENNEYKMNSEKSKVEYDKLNNEMSKLKLENKAHGENIQSKFINATIAQVNAIVSDKIDVDEAFKQVIELNENYLNSHISKNNKRDNLGSTHKTDKIDNNKRSRISQNDNNTNSFAHLQNAGKQKNKK